MTSISPINFRGNGTESAGSIAYRNNSPEIPANQSNTNFRGSGAESTGSMANNPLQQPEKDIVQFRGAGTETTGSIAHSDKPVECPNCGTTVNFKGSDKKDNKTAKILGVIGGLVGLTAAGIIALGYAHKTGKFANLGEGWFAKNLKRLEPAGKKCHDWCAVVKQFGLDCWNRLKNIGSSKKD